MRLTMPCRPGWTAWPTSGRQRPQALFIPSRREGLTLHCLHACIRHVNYSPFDLRAETKTRGDPGHSCRNAPHGRSHKERRSGRWFVLMENLGIPKAVAFDANFREAGFAMFP